MKIPTLFKEYIWLVNTIYQARKISLVDLNGIDAATTIATQSGGGGGGQTSGWVKAFLWVSVPCPIYPIITIAYYVASSFGN